MAEKDEKILSSGMADKKINDLIEQRNAIAKDMTEKRSAFDACEDVEKRDGMLKEVEELKKQVEDIDKQIEAAKQEREKLAAQEKKMSLIGSVDEMKVEKRNEDRSIYASEEYAKAWQHYVLTGDDREARSLETRAGVATTTTNVPIPTLLQGAVETAWAEYGKFSNLCSTTSVKGIWGVPTETAADPAVWHDEGAAASDEESITLGQVLLQPKMINKWISVTDELSAMAPTEFMRYINDELVYRVIKILDDSIIARTDASGKGVIGIVDNPNTISVSSALTFNAVNSVVGQLIKFDNLTIAMNPQTFFTNVLGLTDLQNRPIYNVMTDNTGKPRYFMAGYPVEFTDAIKAYDSAAADEVWAVVGDFSGYRLNFPDGKNVSLLTDPYTLARDGKMYTIGKLFVAGNVTRLKYFGQIKKPTA